MSGFGSFGSPDVYRSWLDDSDHAAPIIPAEIDFILNWELGQLYFFGVDGLKGEESYSFLWEGIRYWYMGERKTSQELWEHLKKTRSIKHHPGPRSHYQNQMHSDKDYQAVKDLWYQTMKAFWDWKFSIEGRLNERSFQSEFQTYRLGQGAEFLNG